MMLKIKKLVLLVTLALQSFGFSVGDFFKILQDFRLSSSHFIAAITNLTSFPLFRDQYFEILMSECRTAFERTLATDNYAPLVVHNEAEYNAVLEKFPFHQRMHDVRIG